MNADFAKYRTQFMDTGIDGDTLLHVLTPENTAKLVPDTRLRTNLLNISARLKKCEVCVRVCMCGFMGVVCSSGMFTHVSSVLQLVTCTRRLRVCSHSTLPRARGHHPSPRTRTSTHTQTFRHSCVCFFVGKARTLGPRPRCPVAV